MEERMSHLVTVCRVFTGISFDRNLVLLSTMQINTELDGPGNAFVN